MAEQLKADLVDVVEQLGGENQPFPPGGEENTGDDAGILDPYYDPDKPTWSQPFALFCYRTKILISQISLNEISGSFGDLGSFVPLVVALARQRAIYLVPSLFFAGVANVFTGYAWDVPTCVQPMKSIAAVAIAEDLNLDQVTAAGVEIGILMVFLAVTHLIELVNVVVPLSVVSGLQVGVGLRLAIKGLHIVQDLNWVDQPDCILVAVLCSFFCLWLLRENEFQGDDTKTRTIWDKCWNPKTQHPTALYLFSLGCLFAAVELVKNKDKYDTPLRFFQSPVATWALDSIGPEDWKTGFLEGALPQLPLTTLNSVISVCCLANSFYPERRRHDGGETDAVVSRREVTLSVGLKNLLLCPLGAMPTCHGAGGLAAQHRFGARHGASVAFLGVAMMLLAGCFGSSALVLLDAFPASVLGVMLAISGQELATTGITSLVHAKNSSKMTLRKNIIVSLITGLVIIGTGKTHVGALAGWISHMVYGDGLTDFIAWVQINRSSRSGSHHEEGKEEDEESGR